MHELTTLGDPLTNNKHAFVEGFCACILHCCRLAKAQCARPKASTLSFRPALSQNRTCIAIATTETSHGPWWYCSLHFRSFNLYNHWRRASRFRTMAYIFQLKLSKNAANGYQRGRHFVPQRNVRHRAIQSLQCFGSWVAMFIVSVHELASQVSSYKVQHVFDLVLQEDYYNYWHSSVLVMHSFLHLAGMSTQNTLSLQPIGIAE